MGFLGEILAGIQAWQARRHESDAPPDHAPADGAVRVIPVSGMRGVENTEDPRFQRFIERDPNAQVPATPSRRSRAKVPSLLGRVGFVSIFLGQYGKSWSDREIAQTQAALLRVGEWLEREAMRYHAAVDIELAQVYFAGVDDLRPTNPAELAIVAEEYGAGLMEAHAEVEVVSAASRVAASLGFHDVGDLATELGNRLAASTVVWFLHPRSCGRSFVVPEKDTGMAGVNLAVCFAHEDDQPGALRGAPFPDPTTFAHEALHLFGASDKYGISLSRFAKASVTHRDIMRLDFETLSKLRIDPATAAEIGWR